MSRVVDIHAHVRSDGFDEWLLARGTTPSPRYGVGAGTSDSDLEARLAVMDEAGVDVQVVSIGNALPYFEDGAAAIEAAQLINDEFYDLCARADERLIAVATVPMPDVTAALSELHRAVDELGCRAVGLTTTIGGLPLSDPSFAPLLEEFDRRRLTLLLHPCGESATWPPIGGFGMGLTATLGMLVEDSAAVGHVILSGLQARYPGIKIVNPHLGGMSTMIPRRYDNLCETLGIELVEPPSVTMRRMWYDTVAHAHLPALCCALDTLGADRLLFGTDFPFESAEVMVESLAQTRSLGLTQTELEGIEGGTALALLDSG